jgi:hypothetical protein
MSEMVPYLVMSHVRELDDSTLAESPLVELLAELLVG